MTSFLEQLNQRNPTLYYFGWLCLLTAFTCLVLIPLTHTRVAGVNAWYKPLKFGLSAGIFAWTMGWYGYYLGPLPIMDVYSWSVTLLLGFEVAYIAVQAGRGQRSHYNVDAPVYALLYGAMGLAAVAATLGTAYLGVLFCQRDFPALPTAYLWSIRMGIGLFGVFALQGVLMGARGSHTVGAPDGGLGVPIVHWSRRHGDLRIAHFMGMHAIQILPLLSFYWVTNSGTTLTMGLLYGLLNTGLFVQAMRGKPLFNSFRRPVSAYSEE